MLRNALTLLAGLTLIVRVMAAETPAQQTAGENEDFSIGLVTPKIEAGKVRWHGTFEKAARVSGESGKPVLAFYLVGNLDEALC